MVSSLTASLLLLSVVFMQFVSAADQNISTVKAEPGENVILTCKDPDQGEIRIAEWKRTDLGSSEFVLLYKDGQIYPDDQLPSYRNRVDLLLYQIKKGDVSLILKDTTTDDSGTYECRIAKGNVEKLISTVSLVVSEPIPVWAIVLLVLLVQALVAAAAGVSFYFWLRWKPVPEQVEVKAGVESVLLPWEARENLDGDVRVEWRDGWNRKVHVYQNGSNQPGEQSQFYRTRTKLAKNLLNNKNLSLILKRPTYGDSGFYSCRVYNRDGHVLMKKDIWLKVKAGTDQEDTAG